MEEKECNKCKTSYPATDEYFYKQLVRTKTKGDYYKLSPWCKTCAKENTKNGRIGKEQEHRDYNLKRYHEKKERFRETEAIWRVKKADHLKEYRRNYRRSDNGKAKFREYGKKYRTKKHIISHKEWISCKDYFGNRCAYCGMTFEKHKEIHNQDLHREHVDPFGSVYLDNCIPSCKLCNISKQDKKLDEWYNENNTNYSFERISKIHKWLDDDYKIYFEGYRDKINN